MKKSILILLGLFSISFVSAAYYGGGFSLSDFLNEIDEETMILGTVFIVSFAFLNLSLGKVFKDNKSVASIVGFILALLLTWGINKTGFDFEGLFYDIGFSGGFLSVILPLILIAGFVFMVIKIKLGSSLMVVGALLLWAGLANFFYEDGATIALGVFLLILGAFINNPKILKKKSGST